MKKLLTFLFLTIALTALSGCATATMKLVTSDFKALQTTAKGDPTNGCIAYSLVGMGGINGSTGKALVTWGAVTPETASWCIGTNK
jgi:hypothetical protein